MLCAVTCMCAPMCAPLPCVHAHAARVHGDLAEEHEAVLVTLAVGRGRGDHLVAPAEGGGVGLGCEDGGRLLLDIERDIPTGSREVHTGPRITLTVCAVCKQCVCAVCEQCLCSVQAVCGRCLCLHEEDVDVAVGAVQDGQSVGVLLPVERVAPATVGTLGCNRRYSRLQP